MIDPLGWPGKPAAGDAITREIMITNKRGLHARASAKFVQTVELYQCQVTVTKGGETVGGTSIMGILTLGAGIGTTITVTAAGSEAAKAMDAIAALVANRFGEDE